jgi:photoactive yellow protein
MFDRPTLVSIKFADISLTDLAKMSDEEVDSLSFGVVGLSSDGIAEVYNRTESRWAGLPTDSVIGEHFFFSTAQCMNNFLVAQRFEDEAELDVVLDFILTLRMRPTPVRLRLLKSSSENRRYILIDREG